MYRYIAHCHLGIQSTPLFICIIGLACAKNVEWISIKQMKTCLFWLALRSKIVTEVLQNSVYMLSH